MAHTQSAPTAEDVESYIAESPEPVATAVEIADAFGVSRQLVNDRLKTLRERDAVVRKEVGSRAVVYWPAG